MGDEILIKVMVYVGFCPFDWQDNHFDTSWACNENATRVAFSLPKFSNFEFIFIWEGLNLQCATEAEYKRKNVFGNQNSVMLKTTVLYIIA